MKLRLLWIFALLILLLPLSQIHAGAPLAFSAPVNFPLGPMASAAVTGNLDNDSLADVVVAQKGSDNVRVLLGTGAFGEYPSTASPSSVVLGDFNLNSKTDIVTGSNVGVSTSVTVSLLVGNGDGTFQAPT